MSTTLVAASMAMFYYVNQPVAEMREGPAANSEIVSQAYFSEEVSPCEESGLSSNVSGEWMKIQTKVDGYKGWVKRSSVCMRKNPYPLSGDIVARVNRCAAHLYDKEDTIYGPIMTLPFESRLVLMKKEQEHTQDRWIKVCLPDGREGYIQRGDISFDCSPLSKQKMCELAERFLNLPYTWGGRSSFGYDCSGFVQMLYRQMHILIPRDSKDQIRWEKFSPVSMDQLSPGDCIFFGLAKDNIRHVGLYVGDGKFIHATVAENAPYIHKSSLSSSEWNGNGRFVYREARTLKQ